MARSGLKNTLVDGWEPSRLVAKWARARGYGEAFALSDANLKALAERHGGVTSGLYLLEATNHEIYIGVSTAHIRSRFNDHTGKWPDIQVFRFIPSVQPMRDLRARERSFVYAAERANLIHRNHEYASVIGGVKRIDELIDKALQEEWRRDPPGTNLKYVSDSLALLEPSQLAGNRYKYERLKSIEDGRLCLELLAAYLRNCVPLPIRSEATYWTTTCYPDWNKKGRLLTCTMDWIEMLYVYQESNSGGLKAVLAVDKRDLPSFGFRSRLWTKHHARYIPSFHKSGGAYAVGLMFNDLRPLVSALRTDGYVARGAASFALSRMSRGQSAYKPSHNRNLAAPALRLAFPEKTDW